MGFGIDTTQMNDGAPSVEAHQWPMFKLSSVSMLTIKNQAYSDLISTATVRALELPGRRRRPWSWYPRSPLASSMAALNRPASRLGGTDVRLRFCYDSRSSALLPSPAEYEGSRGATVYGVGECRDLDRRTRRSCAVFESAAADG